MLNSFKEIHGGHKGHQSVPNTTSPMPLYSKNWFGLVEIA
jgi:hypothetical protein